MILCNMTDVQWEQLSTKLKTTISSQEIVNKVSIIIV